jgi:hypothetical protein
VSIPVRFGVAAIVTTFALAACAFIAPRFNGPRPPYIASPSYTLPMPAAAFDLPSSTVSEQAEPSDEPVLDFRGNEVSDAVARYKLDPTGVLYEEHSPHTELPRLPGPKS